MKPRTVHRNRTTRVVRGTLVAAFVAIASSVLYAGCSSNPAPATPVSPSTKIESSGGAQSTAAPAAPTDVSSTRPTTLGEAEAQFADAERQLDGVVGTQRTATPLSTGACEVACKALESMRNATTHLCELATDEPARCDDAKSRLERATSRVNEVCPACAGT